jgi:hypothetical protein
MNHEVVIPTILFNLSIMLNCSSIILILLVFFQIDINAVFLEAPSRKISKIGKIPIGRILKGRIKKRKFCLPFKDLEKHMFVCGATGTGKSNFLQNFLINFSKICNIPFFLVEFKGEYHFLQKIIDDILIFWPGENFSINIFDPGSTSPIIHAERVFDILKSGKFLDENAEFSPQMEKVLVEIIIKVCQNKEFQNWKGFEIFCDEYLTRNKNIIPMLNQTLISIKNRIRRFSTGPLKALFETKNNFNMYELFERNILLDLSSIIRLGGEKEDALFFLNMILKYLWDKNLMQGAFNFKGIKHITIIEDAQYFAPQDLMKKSKITTYLEDIALLQRGTGECLITLATRPDISKEILANNGISLTFKTHIEKELMCELLNLDSENKNFLSMLEEGQCIIRTNSIKEPFLLKVPFIKQKSLNFTEIRKNNKRLLNKRKEWNYSSNEFKRVIPFFHFKKKSTGSPKSPCSKLKKYKKERNLMKESPISNDFNKSKTLKLANINSKNELESKAFDDLENYIKKLNKIQNEKE